MRQLMCGLRPSHCGWLQLEGGRGRTLTSRSDSLKQTELFGRLIKWLMELVILTIKVHIIMYNSTYEVQGFRQDFLPGGILDWEIGSMYFSTCIVCFAFLWFCC